MLTIQVGNVNIHFLPIILYAVILFIIVAIRTIRLWKQYTQLMKDCQEARYGRTITTATKLMRYYRRCQKIFSTKKIKTSIEVLNIYLAISYWGMSDDQLFLQHMQCVGDSFAAKHFWLALYDLLNDKPEEASAHYHAMIPNEETQVSLDFLDGIMLYKQGNTEEAKNKLERLYPKLHYVLLKEIAKDFMK